MKFNEKYFQKFEYSKEQVHKFIENAKRDIQIADEDDRYPQEIFQWWAVSNYLAERLIEAGEPVIDNNYGTWWGRTCCGQALYMDYSLQQIAGDSNES